jgi:D-3-phosphoglycerate dehydrogenase
MNILVVGDSYMASSYFRSAFERVEKSHMVKYVEVDRARSSLAPTESELLLREYEGSPEELVELAHGFEILVVHGAPVTEEVLALGGLGLVCCARGGPVNIDLDAASSHGIPVVTTPGKNAAAVADLTLAFLVMLARRFPNAERFLQEGERVGTSAFEGAQFFGHDLGGHVLGLVGYGHVGRQVAARAVGFGMAILMYDPYLPGEPAEPIERVGRLEELLGRADFVSLHVRASAENENLFGTEEFAAMRLGAFFVNTARETLVDEPALVEALSSGRLAGVALDVVRPRTDGRHPLLAFENVVMTPHIGGATHETLLRGAGMVAEQILGFAAGAPLEHVANAAGVET